MELDYDEESSESRRPCMCLRFACIMLKETYSPVGGPTPTEGCEFSNLPWSLKKCNYHFSKSQTIYDV